MRRVRFLPVLDRAFWNTYECLGTGIKVNAFSLLFFLPLFTIPAGLSGLLYCVYSYRDKGEASYRDFLDGVYKYGIRATVFFACFLAVFGLLFLVTIPFLTEVLGIVGKILAVVTFWIMIILLLGSVYVVPLIIRGNKLGASIRFSLLFFFMHPLYTLLLVLISTCVFSVGLSLILPFLIIVPFALVQFLDEATSVLITEYGEKQKTHNDDFKKRNLGSVIKPWE